MSERSSPFHLFHARGLLGLFVLLACLSTPWLQAAKPEDPTLSKGQILSKSLTAEFYINRGSFEKGLDIYDSLTSYYQSPDLWQHLTTISASHKKFERALGYAQSWSQSAPDNSEASLITAYLALLQGQTLLAEQSLKTLAGLVPAAQLQDALFALYQQLKPYGQAGAYLRVIADLAQKTSLSGLYLATIELSLYEGHMKQALALSEKAQKEGIHSVDLSILTIEALYQNQRITQAEEKMQALLKQDHSGKALLYAVHASLDTQEKSVAHTLLKKSLSDATKWDEDKYMELARLSFDMHWYDIAQALYTPLLKGPRHHEASYGLGMIALQEQNIEQALAYFEKAQGAFEVKAHIQQAHLYHQMGASTQALDLLKSTYSSSDADAKMILLTQANILLDTQNYEQANLLLHDSPYQQDPDILYYLGLSAYEQRQFNLMESYLQSCLAKNPHHVHALNTLGFAYLEYMDKPEQSLVLLQRAYQLAPRNAYVLDSLGWYYLQMQDVPRAIQYLEQAYALVADPDIAWHLSQALLQGPNPAQAQAFIELIKHRYPQHAQVQSL